jgi:glycosyltransferase involved in cell wall biosynthesis
MHLVIVTNILAPYRIGLFQEIERQCGRLTILVLAASHKERLWELPGHALQVEVIPGVQIRTKGRMEPVHLNVGLIQRLIRLQPDCVLSGGFAPGNVEAWVYCQLFKRPFMNWGELTLRDGASGSAIRRAVRRLLCTRSAGVIASSTASREAYCHYGADGRSAIVAPMPVDVAFFGGAAAGFRESDDYDPLRESASWPRLITVGSVERQKGFAELFRIYDRLILRFPGASLWIAGEGAEREEYERYCRERGWRRVRFLGFIQREELVRYYAAADVFVFPSLCDAYGAVIAEAMASGLPVVSSVYAAATFDLVQDGVSGFHIDPSDAAESADTVARALDQPPASREAMLQSASERVAQATFGNAARTMVGHVSSVLERHRHL